MRLKIWETYLLLYTLNELDVFVIFEIYRYIATCLFCVWVNNVNTSKGNKCYFLMFFHTISFFVDSYPCIHVYRRY